MLTIDTIKIQSPILSDKDRETFFHLFNKKIITHMVADKLEKETIFFNGFLEGSFDHRISLSLNGDALMVEGSLHKFLFSGQNVVGGTLNIKDCRFLIRSINNSFGTSISDDLDFWGVYRIDLSINIFHYNPADIDRQLFLLKNSYFPRRDVQSYPTSVNIGSSYSNTLLKAYHKGAEFIKHDKKRIALNCTDSLAEHLQMISNFILRWEVEIKRSYLFNKLSPVIVERKYLAPNRYQHKFDEKNYITKKYTARMLHDIYLKKGLSKSAYGSNELYELVCDYVRSPNFHHKGLPVVSQFNKKLCMNLFNSEFNKMLMENEEKSNIQKLCTFTEVSEALLAYSPRGAGTLIGTYTQISTLGFSEARRTYKRNNKERLFRRHVKIFDELNINLLQSDIQLIEMEKNILCNPTTLVDFPDLTELEATSESIQNFFDNYNDLNSEVG